MLKRITPQNEARIQWETEVQAIICNLLECTNGDAQGIIEAQGYTIDDLYTDDKTPHEAAAIIAQQSGQRHDINPLQIEFIF